MNIAAWPREPPALQESACDVTDLAPGMFAEAPPVDYSFLICRQLFIKKGEVDLLPTPP